MIKHVCPICKTIFYNERNKSTYCSRKCSGIKHAEFMKGSVAWNKEIKVDREKYPLMGHFTKHSEETKVKMRGKVMSKKQRNSIRKRQTGLYGEKSNRWEGGRTKDSAGYILVYSFNHPFKDNKGYVREHRLIIEKQIGRYLTPEEKCHHLGEKDDNRPHMLMAFVNNSAHMRFHHNPNNVKPEEIIFDGRVLSGYAHSTFS